MKIVYNDRFGVIGKMSNVMSGLGVQFYELIVSFHYLLRFSHLILLNFI